MKPVVTILCLLILLNFSCAEPEASTQFTLLKPSKTGIRFKNILRETEQFNVLEYGYLYNGGGVAIGDLNNDGLADIYFTGNMVGSRLYINQGDWKFEEIAEKAGVFAEGLWNTGTTMADVNADGYLDIYICRSAAQASDKRRNLLFINNGDLTFTEKGAEYGVNDAGYSTQGAFFDYDKDGDLDLYVLNHSTQEYAGFGQITASLKNRKNKAYSDKLYQNNNGKFTDVSDSAGLISNVLGFGLGIAISDVNNDSWPDLYVSNDYNEQDYLYINNQDGTFTESLEQYIGHISLFSMGSDIADVNNDGYTDILTLDMLPEGNYRQKMVSGPDNYDKYQRLVNSGFYNQTMRNMLQLNNQGTSFSEVGQFAGISNSDWSWASLLADLDNDGYKDLFVSNGYKRDYTNMDFINYAVQEKLNEDRTGQRTAIMQLLEKMPSTVEENYTYHNQGDLRFEKVNSLWGLDQKSLSNGAAYGDLDNDGDLDLVVNNIDQEPFVYRNNAEKIGGNNFLKLVLKGDGQNTFGVGARVTLSLGNGSRIVQELMPSRGYQSSVDFNLVFGLGNQSTVDTLSILWPDSRKQILTAVAANQTLVINQADAAEKQTLTPTNIATYFTDISADSSLVFLHKENSFVDFKREQLLPHKLSTQGPGMATADINADGLDDLYIGGAKGSPGALLIQLPSGNFQPSNLALFESDALSEDVEALFFDADGDQDPDLYVVSGGSDFTEEDEALQDRLYLNNGRGVFVKSQGALPEMRESGSCVSAGDIDKDGDQDLFVGARLVPGKYPTSPKSFVLLNNGKGKFTDNTSDWNAGLQTAGMVTDALWTDFDGDQLVDLLVVGEWMKVRLFRNTGSALSEISDQAGMENSEGWWNTITEADLDGDGDLDYVLGNFGHNSQLKANTEEPVSLYVKDFDANGSLDPIMCSYIMGESYPVFSKDDLVGQLNGLKTRYTNYADYADQKITDIFSEEELKDAERYYAKNFATSVLENLGNGQFSLNSLPGSAQFSPVYGIVSEDFNSDGNADLLLAGNFFGTRVKYGRYDANKGLILLGDGNNNFKPVDAAKSGLGINGEVRDIARVSLGDGTTIFIFAMNNRATQVYRFNP
ncbi:VCBS repeat-containing protein [Poritiphilus flavus]|uniref:RNA-binding protein n=1 Tax=Poritiphilus flavus TaxID=2697053 RepID=A0A6L9E709_9FLAO|nr:VCBS repeat-containing protein [Poritiphilus flavus]NAS10470.1 RNA-binding protein [Poritiphilus flavus]